MISLATLGLIAFICFGSVLIAPHAYDAVYPDYVMAPASIVPHPDTQELEAGVAAFGERIHQHVTLSRDKSYLTIPIGRPIDLFAKDPPAELRVPRLLETSDMFEPAHFVTLATDHESLNVGIRIKPQLFLFGTDANGRDLLTRILVAGRISLAVGALASFVALGIGVTWGAIAGYVGGRVDGVMMRIVDVIFALPFIFLVIVLLVFFGRSLWLIFIAIGAVEWLDMARIVRGQTLSLKRREFVLAARALGATDRGILAQHIVPNMSGPIVAYLALLVPRVILAESFLSFLGIGVQEPLTSWGVLIADGARHVQGAAHLLVFPALALAITVVAANQLGEALLRVSGSGAR